MYCAHCGAEYKKSWRMPSHCHNCGAEVSYEPHGRMNLVLVIALAVGLLVGWVVVTLLRLLVDPSNITAIYYGRLLAPVLAVAAMLVSYSLFERLFVRVGFLHSPDLSETKPPEVEAPQRHVKLNVQQQIALNFSKLDLPGQEGAAGTDRSKPTASPQDTPAGSSDMPDDASRRVAHRPAKHASDEHGARPSLAEAFRATQRATEEQYSGEAQRESELRYSKAAQEYVESVRGAEAAQAACDQRGTKLADDNVTASGSAPGPAPAHGGTPTRGAFGTSGATVVANATPPASQVPSSQVPHTVLPAASYGGHTGTYDEVRASDVQGIHEMGELSSAIVKEHFDPIIGPEQNDYMIARFNTADAIADQIANHGYRYFFACDPEASASAGARERHIGFVAFYPREVSTGSAAAIRELYLSKFYLVASKRGRGLSRDMCRFVVDHARALGCSRVVLNVNRNNYQAILAYEHLGFRKVREEKNDIGGGYYMDDFVYELPVA